MFDNYYLIVQLQVNLQKQKNGKSTKTVPQVLVKKVIFVYK